MCNSGNEKNTFLGRQMENNGTGKTETLKNMCNTIAMKDKKLLFTGVNMAEKGLCVYRK